MFDDIILSSEEEFTAGPSHLEIVYFKDGESYEYDVNITSKELLGALPFHLKKPMNDLQINLLIETIKNTLLLEKCLLLSSNMV